MRPVRIATRASALALAQAGQVGEALERALGRPVELVRLTTTGDRLRDVSLAKVGGKGLFVKEIEEALRDGRADLAVHSAKDLPARVPDDFTLAAFPPRVDARDALCTRPRGGRLETLREGARVGTGSARRGSQLRALRPDLDVVPLRGNVDTRLRKLADEGLDAVVLACAGLERLARTAVIDERIAPELLLPAVGQGVLALETRAGEALADDVRGALDEPATRACITAERAFLTGLEGDCTVPLAALAEHRDGALHLRGLLASPDGAELVRIDTAGPVAEAARLGADAARDVRARGGDAILSALRAGEARG